MNRTAPSVRLSQPLLFLVASFAVLGVSFAEDAWNSLAAAEVAYPAGWQPMAQRDEIRPTFAYHANGGPKHNGTFVISTSHSSGDNGWFQKTYAVVGGKTVRFQAVRQIQNVAAPHRSVVARIVWKDTTGKSVLADVPATANSGNGHIPLAEPEHPLDAETSPDGWTTVTGVYRVPSNATQAVVELHLQWAPDAVCRWSDVSFEEIAPLPERKVRLASIHYVPSGESPQKNCAEFALLIAQAAAQKADLIVLGETVTYPRVGKKPHEVAETVPGPATDYFGTLAKQHHTHLVVGLYERDEKVVYNVAVLIGPDGKLIGKYRKVCLPHSEIENGVTPGDEYPVFQTAFGKVGMMVCYDGFFPEVARELTNHGAEVIAWPVWGCNPLLAKARACENHVYLVSSTFSEPKAEWMISAVYDHAGEPIAKADKWGEIAIAEVDLNQRYFWRNNLGDFHSMVQRHRPPPTSTENAGASKKTSTPK